MKTLIFKRSRLILRLATKGDKRLFLFMNIALIFGGICIISNFLFLYNHLEDADKILWLCLPGFCLGLALMLLYHFGYRKLSETNHQLNRHKIISFREQ